MLVDGPAGTGKTLGVLLYVKSLCEQYAGIRCLLVRQTRSSLTDSILPHWESLFPPHARILQGATAANRARYRFSNTSVVVVGGLDKPERTFSAQYDVIVVEEAIEITLDAWEKLIRANRNNVLPWQQMIANTNPGRNSHWLNRRPEQWVEPFTPCEECEGDEWAVKDLETTPPQYRCAECGAARDGDRKMRRLVSRHKDNPAYWSSATGKWTEIGRKYMRRLRGMSGGRYNRLYLGQWVGEEGLVYPMWDASIHCIHAEMVEDEDGNRLYSGEHQVLRVGSWGGELVEMRWFFASVDWGFRNPGSMSVWGVDSESRLFRVAQVYRTGKQLDWWAERAVEFDEEFHLTAIVCDSAEPRSIEVFNDRLSGPMNRASKRIARKADKDWLAGSDMVRYGLSGTHPEDLVPGAEVPPEKLEPRMFFCKDSLRHGVDPDLDAEGLPTCTEHEVEGYTWLKTTEGKEVKDKPDPACPDHGLDETRYACMYAWKRDMTPVKPPRRAIMGTMAALLDHDSVRRGRRKKEDPFG